MTIGTIVLVSCNKESQASSQEQSGMMTNSIEESPFDYIGETHNQLLFLIGKNLSEDISDYVQLEYKTEESRDSLIEKISSTAALIMKDIAFPNISLSEMENLIDSAFIMADGDDFESSNVANSIEKIFNKYQGISSLDDLQLAIRSTELDMTRSTMSATDSQVVACLNIYYHSMNFWKDATFNENNPWHVLIYDINNNPNSYIFNTTKRVNLKNWLKKAGDWFHSTFQHLKEKYTWEKIALADLYGAGLGAGLAISNPVVGPSAIVISGTAMSAVGPLFM